MALTLLVDAPSLIYRALFSTPDTVRTPAGEPINAVHGFLGMLAGLIAGQRPDALACAEDADWRPQWRVDLIPGYKVHRTLEGSAAVEAEQRLAPQFPILREIMQRCGLPLIGVPDFEAEDVLGTLAARAVRPGGAGAAEEDQVAIFSGDRDLFQLVHDPYVSVLYPRRGTSDLLEVDEGYITRTYGIPGRAYAAYAILRGDPSDGLPGARGIGDKSAAALVAKYGDLAGVLAAADAAGPAASGPLGKVRLDRDYLTRAEAVVRIRTDLPIPELDLTRRAVVDTTGLWELAEANGLTNAVRRLVDALG
ncbi:MAG TPA: 5'-3' exonuclease H3TH domain-containing protein [Actinomycetota bacterium]|nr:5'-3' exonuclease H3TH domain-containing protein [Actinomycetota bacterium]